MSPTPIAAWDVLVRGATPIDPAQSISGRRDVTFRGGQVAAVAETLTGDATAVIDAPGAMITPGLIDLHAHVYRGLSTGRDVDQTSLANGVTTVVDAGTTGWMDGAGHEVPTARRLRTRHVIRAGRLLPAAQSDRL